MNARPVFDVRPRFAVGIIALVAFFVRLLHVLSYEPWPTNDMAVYVRTALKNLTLSNLFTPDGITWFPPGYSFFIKPFLLALEPDAALLAVRILQAALGAWTCVLIYHLAARIHSRRAGLVASLLTCFYPHFLLYSSAYMSENLFIPLYLASLLALLRSARVPGAGGLYRAGLLAGATALVRPVAASLAPAFFYAAWKGGTPGVVAAERAGGARAARLRALALLLAGCFTLIGPWAIRNRIAYGHFVLISPNGAFNLAVGNQSEATGVYTEPPSIMGNLWSRMDYFHQTSVGFITNDPWGEAFVIARLKWPAFWELIQPWPLYSSNPGLFDGEIFFPFVSWRVVLALGLAGAGAILAGRRPGFWVTPLCFIAYAGFYMMFFGGTRFRLPAEAFFLAWSGAGVASIVKSLPRVGRARAGEWGGVISLLLAITLVESAWSASRTRGFLLRPESYLASGDQIPLVPGKPPILPLGDRIPLDRSVAHYLRLEFSIYRQGPPRDTPDNGFAQITFLDRSGGTLPWLDNPKYFLEAIPPDRWVQLSFRAHIPPSATSCRVTVASDRNSPDTVILDHPLLQYSRGNDLAFEFLYPYLRYEE